MNRNEEHFHDILSKLDDEIKISDRDFREAMRLLEGTASRDRRELSRRVPI